MKKIVAKKLVAATYSVDNSDDTDRVFEISAEADTSNGRVRNIKNGRVFELGENDGRQLADFSYFSGLSSNIFDVQTSYTKDDVFSAISQFCTKLNGAIIELQ